MDLREQVLEKKVFWLYKWQRRKLKNWRRKEALGENLVKRVSSSFPRSAWEQRGLADAVESLYGIITSSKEYGKQLKKKGLYLSNTLPCNCQRSEISCLSVNDQHYKHWIYSCAALVSFFGLLCRCGCSHVNLLLCFEQTFLLVPRARGSAGAQPWWPSVSWQPRPGSSCVSIWGFSTGLNIPSCFLFSYWSSGLFSSLSSIQLVDFLAPLILASLYEAFLAL